MTTIVGVDVGGTLLRAARFDQDLTQLDRAEQPTRVDLGEDMVMGRLVETIRQVLPESSEELLGIGLALPGPLDADAGILIAPPNLPFKDVPICEMVEDAVGGRVYIGNDADLAGLGEYTLGAGQDAETMVYMTISTGVGGGLIHKGHILTGRGQGGEVGHMPVLPDGPICSCGKPGHLEAVASGPSIAHAARERIAAGESSTIKEMVAGDLLAITSKIVGKAAQQRDELALDVITQAGHYVGISIAALMMLLNPDMFVLGGGVTNLGDLLFEPIKKAVREYALHPRYYENVPIVHAQLGADVGLYGAAALVQRKINRV